MTNINKLDQTSSPRNSQSSRREPATRDRPAAEPSFDAFAAGASSHLDARAVAISPLPATPRKRPRVARESSPPLQRIPLISPPHLASRAPLVVRDVTLPSGKRLFVDVGKIGSGSFGHVLQAIDEQGDLHVVKEGVSVGRPSPTRTRVTRPLARIEYEQAMVSRFCGPSEIYRTEHAVAYTMPWFPASLDILISRLSVADRHALAPATLLELLDLLSAMHAQQVAHGDIKPDNFLLSPQGELRLGDLGCSGPFVPCGHTEPGDFNRLAPEQRGGGLSESVPLNAQTDVWAAGIIIWELATGSHNPFQGTLQDYVDWHGRQPRDGRGRINIAEVPRDDAWGRKVRELEDGAASQVPVPGLADVLVNDLNHPDPARRADAAGLRQRLPSTWSAVTAEVRGRRADVLLNTTTVQRKKNLQDWWRTRDAPVDPEAGYTTP